MNEHLVADQSLGRVSSRAVLNSINSKPGPPGVAAGGDRPASPRVLPNPPARSKHKQEDKPTDKPYETEKEEKPVEKKRSHRGEHHPDYKNKTDMKQTDKTDVKQTDKTDLKQTDVKQTDKTVVKQTDKTDVKQTDVKQTDKTDVKQTDKTDVKQTDKHREKKADKHPDKWAKHPDKRTDKEPQTTLELQTENPTTKPDGRQTRRGRPDPLAKILSDNSALCEKDKTEEQVPDKVDEKEAADEKKKTKEKEPLKQKLSDKPSSRLSVEHQLLGVSNSSISNCTDGDNDRDLITVNEGIQKAGIGKYHLLPFLVMLMILLLKCFLDGFTDNFGSVFSCVFDMDHTKSQLLNAFGFVASFFGAPIGGVLADKFGRRLVAGCGLLLLLVVTCAITAAASYTMMAVFYVLFSMLVSGIYPVMFVYVTELSPTKTRYLTVLFCFIFYSLISFILPFCIIPLYHETGDGKKDLENDYWRVHWGLLLVPILVSIGVLFFSPESPRYNCAKGKAKKAQRTVLQMLDTNLNDRFKVRERLSTLEISSCAEPLIRGFSLPKLFYRPIQSTTILLVAFLFVCNFQFFASHVLTEEMLTNRCQCGIDITYSNGVPWSENFNCDAASGIECNPQDKDGKTCCNVATKMCINASAASNETVCIPYTCDSVHLSAPPKPVMMNSDEELPNGNETDGRCVSSASNDEKAYYIFNGLRNLLYAPGFVVGILLAQYTTRKDAFIHIAFYITFINGLLFAMCKFVEGQTFLIFIPSLAFNTVIGAAYSLSWLYMVEYYPTSLRCSGVGLLAGIGQLGNALGTLLSKELLEWNLNIYGRLTIHLFLSNLLTLLSFMLELETKRLPMSDRKRTDCLDHKLSAKSDEPH